MSLPKFFLASSSPRRRELLRRVGFRFEIVDREPLDETSFPKADPKAFAERLAVEKALRAKIPENERGIVLAFDTIVYIDGEILGKPRDEAEAKRFLARLSGRWHTVFTGVAARRIPEGEFASAVERTEVLFSKLSQAEIDAYVASGEPLDKAGAYGIQRLGALLVAKVDGCFYNVVGLPLLCLTKVLEKLNVKRLELLVNLRPEAFGA